MNKKDLEKRNRIYDIWFLINESENIRDEYYDELFRTKELGNTYSDNIDKFKKYIQFVDYGLEKLKMELDDITLKNKLEGFKRQDAKEYYLKVKIPLIEKNLKILLKEKNTKEFKKAIEFYKEAILRLKKFSKKF